MVLSPQNGSEMRWLDQQDDSKNKAFMTSRTVGLNALSALRKKKARANSPIKAFLFFFLKGQKKNVELCSSSPQTVILFRSLLLTCQRQEVESLSVITGCLLTAYIL